MGIAIDILVVLFVLWSVYRGWKLGLLYQIGYLALLVVAYFASRGIAALLAEPIAKAMGTAPMVGGTVAFFGSFVLLMVLGALLVRRITKDLIPDTSVLSGPNRALGALVSGAKGLLITWVVLVLFLQIQRITGKINLPFESSVAGRFAIENNFLERGETGALAKLAWLIAHKDPRLLRLQKHPKAAALMSPDVLSAIDRQDYVALFQNEALWDFLGDPQVQAELAAIEWVQ